MNDNERLSYDDVSNVIQIFGRFDFSISKEFGERVDSLPQGKAINVDFSYCNYVDSAGVGALLALRMHADPTGSNITLLNCNDLVLEILKIGDIHKFFDINEK